MGRRTDQAYEDRQNDDFERWKSSLTWSEYLKWHWHRLRSFWQASSRYWVRSRSSGCYFSLAFEAQTAKKILLKRISSESLWTDEIHHQLGTVDHFIGNIRNRRRSPIFLPALSVILAWQSRTRQEVGKSHQFAGNPGRGFDTKIISTHSCRKCTSPGSLLLQPVVWWIEVSTKAEKSAIR